MKTKHIPGPWILGEKTDCIRSPGKNAYYHGIIANVRTWKTPTGDAMPANARLIAAAPELLEACEWVNNILRGVGIVSLKLDSVISKARGKF